jgi:uncharacterized protein
MKSSLPQWLWLVLLFTWLPALAQQPVAVPTLQARVTDLTGTLTQGQRDALERKLSDFETRKGSQIAVLVVPTTQPESIEQYSIRVAEQWKLGRKGVDDGALLLVAMDDRALRIEVGYGLEGALSDLVANKIVEDIMVPHFKRGDFVGGIEAGVDAMIRVVDGEPLPEPARAPGPGAGPGGGLNLEALFVIGFILVFVVGGVLRAMIGRLPAAAVIGGATGFIAWAMVASLLAAGVVGIIAFGFTLLGGTAARAGRATRGGWRPPGGFGGGGWGGGGGGFGGGGGGFGGGGASGRW